MTPSLLDGINSPPRGGAGRGSSFPLRLSRPFLLGFGRPVGRGLALVLGLLSSGLCGAGDGALELSIAAQVLEAAAVGEVDVELLDVAGGELVLGLGTGGADAGGEGAEVSEVDLVALDEHLADALAHLYDDAYDGALGENAVVLGDVLGELIYVDVAGELKHCVGLLGLVGLLGVCAHTYAVLNLFHGSVRPLSSSPRGGEDS